MNGYVFHHASDDKFASVVNGQDLTHGILASKILGLHIAGNHDGVRCR